jgi:hypothetical protein
MLCCFVRVGTAFSRDAGSNASSRCLWLD